MLIKSEYKPRMLPKEEQVKKPMTSNGRISFVLMAIAVLFAGLIARGLYLQTVMYNFLKEQGDNRIVRTQTLPATRGTVSDRNGAVLALSAPTESLFAVPKEMKEMPSAAQLERLSELVDVPVDVLRNKLEQKGKSFIWIKRQLDPKVAEEVKALGLENFVFEKELKRHYPMGNLFAHVIGFTNIDGKGQEGLELSREDSLRGEDGAKVVLRDNKGNIVDSLDSPRNSVPKNGQDMILSLDQRIQTLAYDELNKAVAYHKAKAGAVVVLDAQTGEILALVNSPAYDPNQPGQANSEQRRNRAVTDMIEPGSAMKPFTIAKALDSGKVDATDTFNTLPYKIGPATVQDTHVYPTLDVRGIMQKSSNVGTSKLSAMFTPKEMYDFYHDLGVGVRMHSGFPGETAGLLRSWRRWQKIEQATMSFGYGLQLSLLQLARAYTVLTHDGELLPVSFEKQAVVPKGKRVIKASTAKKVRELMVSVTEAGGTGTAGAVDGFDVGAKTGTARKLVNGRYVDNKHVATFIGFAPAKNPRVIVAVTIDEPTANGYYGGVVTGPPFKKIMGGSLNILGVSPTKPLTAAAVKTPS
ncbi:TPA: peptidoglycan D,D-transpeptidase FtsI family protein [Neisseria meningitidis]|uniref:Probable peptidoglycan D,D-transpeptidase PenA n=1 Tax=Neisseria meningitidis TaxID=487 RepID=Q70SY2_NEIME|nr:penicillin-binding protein 2 [Neisseria meningitidis]CAD70592.1 penicillin-binding protein 2 [Neisseria meningitidis]CWO65695.1 penicillin-binding protein 2 [Neisseria meningitidis]CWO76542.1 penicillin-binding protein 2 [Neisseria meningitidis]CWP94343.1 penicillin-binding protein 2 [Neisseria meningitidis]CWQ05874.1 penicillin-binding protein 2 [Neisseria meningitidis]